MILIRLLLFLNDYNKKLQIKFHFLTKNEEKNMQAYISLIIQKMHKYMQKKKLNKKKQHAIHDYSY